MAGNELEAPFPIVTPILPHEEEIWKEVSEKLKEIGIFEDIDKFSDGMKVRFIRGSEFIKKRDKMIARIVKYLQNTLKFRKKYDFDNSLTTQQPNLLKLRESIWPGRFYHKTTNYDLKNLDAEEVELSEKHDKDYSYKKDRAVLFMDLRDAKFAEAKVFNTDTLNSHVLFAMELLRLKFEYTWKCSVRSILIYDLSTLTMKDYYAWYKAGAAKLLGVLGGNFPESVDKIFVLNPSRIFSWVFKLVRPLLEPDTAQKIKLLKGDDEIEAVFKKEAIDIKKLPKKYFTNGTENQPFEFVIDDQTIEYMKSEGDKNIEELLEIIKKNNILKGEADVASETVQEEGGAVDEGNDI